MGGYTYIRQFRKKQKSRYEHGTQKTAKEILGVNYDNRKQFTTTMMGGTPKYKKQIGKMKSICEIENKKQLVLEVHCACSE